MAQGFKLEVGALPPKQKVGLYDAIVSDFAKNVLDNASVTTKSAKVVIPNKKEKTVQIGLAKAVGLSGRKDITVTIRGGEVWLTKRP